MSGINKVILLGRLGQDPELKYTPNGNAVTSFSVATGESWVKDGVKHEETEWHKIVVWGKLAEVCARYLGKGRQVYLEGKNKTRSWEDKNGGGQRYITEVIVDKVEFVGSASDGAGANAGYQNNAQRTGAPSSSRATGNPSNYANQNTDMLGLGDIPF